MLPEEVWSTLPTPTQALACFENLKSGATRVFHFLTIEAKQARIDIDADKALHQSLNNASQALHNTYEFFRDAGSEHEQIFFDKVRFFSVVANRKGLLVRIHRAVELPRDARPGLLVMRDQPNYRLKFLYREFARVDRGDEYSRATVLTVFKNILKYAVDDLAKWIRAAASDLAEKLENDPSAFDARRNGEFYRYGLPSRISSQETPSESMVP